MWTQPCCDPCWIDARGDREPVRMAEAMRMEERCCYCGKPTFSGIYVRTNPSEVPFPTEDG